MNQSSIIQPPVISQLASSSQENSYISKQLRYAIDDQFKFADFKAFYPVNIFEQYQEQGTTFFTSILKEQQQLFDLYILYFFANSHGEQKYLSKFKKLVYNKSIIIPSNTKPDIIDTEKQIKHFFPILVSKLKHYQDNFKSIQQTIKFLHNFETFFYVAKIIFFNLLIQVSDFDEKTELEEKHIKILDQYVNFEQEDIILKWDFIGKKLILISDLSEIQENQIGEQSVFIKSSKVFEKSQIIEEKQASSILPVMSGKIQINVQNPKKESNLKLSQQLQNPQQEQQQSSNKNIPQYPQHKFYFEKSESNLLPKKNFYSQQSPQVDSNMKLNQIQFHPAKQYQQSQINSRHQNDTQSTMKTKKNNKQSPQLSQNPQKKKDKQTTQSQQSGYFGCCFWTLNCLLNCNFCYF